jgi:hypothetical protein
MAFAAMNSSPHHPKVKVSLGLPSHVFVAGQQVRGKLVVESRADKGLGLSAITVKFKASQGKHITSFFLIDF